MSGCFQEVLKRATTHLLPACSVMRFTRRSSMSIGGGEGRAKHAGNLPRSCEERSLSRSLNIHPRCATAKVLAHRASAPITIVASAGEARKVFCNADNGNFMAMISLTKRH